MAARRGRRGSLRDIRLHELATISAMQSAVRALLAQFDPRSARQCRAWRRHGDVIRHRRRRSAWDAFEAAAQRARQALAGRFRQRVRQGIRPRLRAALEKLPPRGRRHDRPPFAAAAAAAAAGLTHCAARQPPAVVDADHDRQRRQNPDTAGTPAPVAVRIYPAQRQTAKFERADVFALIEHEQQTLGQESAGSEEFVLSPGRDPDQDTRAQARRAGYRRGGAVPRHRQRAMARGRAGREQRADKTRTQRRQTCYHAEAQLTEAALGKPTMSWTNRVVWQEGMFLRTQHFQQQDRWLGAAGARPRCGACARIPGG